MRLHPNAAVKILDTISPFVLRDPEINLQRLSRAKKNALLGSAGMVEEGKKKSMEEVFLRQPGCFGAPAHAGRVARERDRRSP